MSPPTQPRYHGSVTRSGVRAGVLGAGLLACAPEPCTDVEGLELWDRDVSGPLCILGDVVVTGRTTAELARLDRIESITGSLLLFANPEWSELPRFAALQDVGGALSISDNLVLTTIDAFPALERIGGTLYIGEHPILVSIALGDRLTELGGLQLALNPELAAIAGLERVESVAGDFVLEDSGTLTTLELPALTRVDGSLRLVALPDLRGAEFPALVRIEQYFTVGGTGLAALTGFSALAFVRHTAISDNPRMTELDLSRCTTHSLGVHAHPRLQRLAASVVPVPDRIISVSITDSPALTHVDLDIEGEQLDGLRLAGNDALTQLTPWTRLKHLERLYIQGNASLTELRAWLPALSRVDEVAIFGNAALPPAAVDTLLAEIEYTGTPRVGDNGGQDTALDPCPWPDDLRCDAEQDVDGQPGTGLCLADPDGCGV